MGLVSLALETVLFIPTLYPGGGWESLVLPLYAYDCSWLETATEPFDGNIPR